MHPTKLHGAIAAVVTPLRDRGRAVDDEGIERLTAFLSATDLDGILTCGTTGEGILLTPDERRHVTERFLAAKPEGFRVAVHAGAQTTADTVGLAAHALDSGADAVAVIAPPYFPLDDEELFRHLQAAARACGPLPFYVYEFAGRSGYPIPVATILRLREEVPNLAGLKVSDTPFDAVRPYLVGGLDVFIGSEPLVLEGLRSGAIGAVSGLASAWPQVTADLVHHRDADAHTRVLGLREALAGMPFHAALKQALVHASVLLRGDVRAPLRGLTDAERAAVNGL